MRIEVAGQNTFVEFPDGMDQAEVQRILQKHFPPGKQEPKLSSRPAYEPERPQDVGTITARHPYEMTVPYGKLTTGLIQIPRTLEAGTPQGEIAFSPEEYAGNLALGFAPMGIAAQIGPVYHGGSGRIRPEPGFPLGRFKSKYIGTGEGAQSFGYGHYFTDEMEIAKWYKENAVRRGSEAIETGWKIGDRIVREGEEGINSAALNRLAWGESKEEVKNYFMEYKQNLQERFNQVSKEEQIELLPVIKKIDKTINFVDTMKDKVEFWKGDAPKGAIYEATLHKGKKPGEYNYLEWGKQISQDINDKIREQGLKEGHEHLIAKASKLDGGNVYMGLARVFGSQKEASAFLKRAGIDGIKYPAGTLSGGPTYKVVQDAEKDFLVVKNRGEVVGIFSTKEKAEEEMKKLIKYNYVVFDPLDITIESVK